MTVICFTCRGCETPLDLHPRDLVLALPPIDQGEDDPEVLYGCRQCGHADAATIDWRVATRLVVDGITTLHGFTASYGAPVELTDPERTQLIPLSLDDLLDLHEQLSQLDQHDLG